MDIRESITCYQCETDYYYPGSCPRCKPWRPGSIDEKITEVLQELKRRKQAEQERKRRANDNLYYGKLI